MGVGLFGGTFDPIHNGHLRVAEEIRGSFALERVYFVPTFIQPLKQRVKAAAPADRYRMIQMAIRDNPFFRASRFEIGRGGVSYTIDTVKAFGRRFGDLYFIIGIDAFSDIRLWRDYRDLLNHTSFIVMSRPSRGGVHLEDVLPDGMKKDLRFQDDSVCEHASGRKIYLHEITELDISSTKIRELHRDGKSIRYLLPAPVERFIEKKGLYTER